MWYPSQEHISEGLADPSSVTEGHQDKAHWMLAHRQPEGRRDKDGVCFPDHSIEGSHTFLHPGTVRRAKQQTQGDAQQRPSSS